jgi:hypothetical protein
MELVLLDKADQVLRFDPDLELQAHKNSPTSQLKVNSQVMNEANNLKETGKATFDFAVIMIGAKTELKSESVSITCASIAIFIKMIQHLPHFTSNTSINKLREKQSRTES